MLKRVELGKLKNIITRSQNHYDRPHSINSFKNKKKSII